MTIGAAWVYLQSDKQTDRHTLGRFQPPKDWETYANQLTHYEIKYPPYWNVIVRGDGLFNEVKLLDATGRVRDYARLFSGRGTGRDVFGFPCMSKPNVEEIKILDMKAHRKTYEARAGSLETFEGESVSCGDYGKAKFVLIEFSADGTGDPLLDHQNPDFREYSFEFYLFDNDFEFVDNVMSTFILR